MQGTGLATPRAQLCHGVRRSCVRASCVQRRRRLLSQSFQSIRSRAAQAWGSQAPRGRVLPPWGHFRAARSQWKPSLVREAARYGVLIAGLPTPRPMSPTPGRIDFGSRCAGVIGSITRHSHRLKQIHRWMDDRPPSRIPDWVSPFAFIAQVGPIQI